MIVITFFGKPLTDDTRRTTDDDECNDESNISKSSPGVLLDKSIFILSHPFQRWSDHGRHHFPILDQ